MNVKSRAHRILKPLVNYHDMTAKAISPPFWIQDVIFQRGEDCVGIYENHPGRKEEAIVITTLGLHIFRNEEWQYISYDQIESVKTPTDKRVADQLEIQLHDNNVASVPIKGGQNNLRDAFSFLRFLDRVVRDLN